MPNQLSGFALKPLVGALAALALFASGCGESNHYTVEERMQRAQDFSQKGDIKSTVIELKNVLQAAPDNPQARLMLGEAYLKEGHASEAEKEFRRAGELGVGRETVMPPLARSLISQGEYQKVLDEIQAEPEFSSINRSRLQSTRADALINTNRAKDACALYDQARQTDPHNAAAYWGLSLCAQIRSDIAGARQFLQDGLQADPDNATTWLMIGNLDRSENKLQAALDAYKKAVQTDPSNTQARAQLGAAFLASSDFKSARAESAAIKKITPGHPEADYLDALALYLERKPAEALPYLQSSLKDGRHLPSAVLYGAVQLELGALEQAERALGVVVNQAPGHTVARRLYAATLLRMGDADRAQAALKPLFSSGRVDSDLLRLAGEASMLEGDFAKAEQYFRQAAMLSPKSAPMLSGLGRSEAAQGNVSEAIRLFSEAASLSDDATQADLLLITTHLNAKQYDEASQAARKLETKAPKSPVVQQMLAAAYDGMGDMANARKHLEAALKLQPDYLPAARGLVGLDLKSNKPEAARRHFETLLKHNPKHTSALLLLAEFDRQQGKPQAYLDGLKKAQQSNPEALEPALLLGRHYLASGSTDQALTLAQDTVRIHPNDARALEFLGSAQLASGNEQNAKVSFERAVALSPRAAHLHALLGTTRLGLNELSAARKALNEALRLDPALLTAVNGLILLNLREGKEEEALKLVHITQQRLPNAAEPIVLEADIQLARKAWESAATLYRKAIALKPSGELQVKLHRAVSHNGALARHDGMLDDWIAKNPQDIAIRIARADMRLARHDFAGAEQDYRAVLKLQPNHVQSLNNLAFLLKGGNNKEALGFAEQAARLAPDNPRVLDTLGTLQIENGDTRRGLGTLSRTVEIAPDYPLYRLNYARALIRAGDKTTAATQLTPLLKLSGQVGDEARKLQGQTR